MSKPTDISVSYDGGGRYLVMAHQPTRSIHFWYTPGKPVPTMYSHPEGKIRSNGKLSRDKPTMQMRPLESKAAAKLLADILVEVDDAAQANARTKWHDKQDEAGRKNEAERVARVNEMLRTDGASLIEALLECERFIQGQAPATDDVERTYRAGLRSRTRAALAKVGA